MLEVMKKHGLAWLLRNVFVFRIDF
jgi:hypothetical protein